MRKINPITTACLVILPTLLLNIGFIYSIENPYTQSRFGKVLDYLSGIIDPKLTSSVVELAIGIATGTLIFFTLIQFVYSFKQFPLDIITKYVTRHRYSLSYLAYQFSTVTVMCLFCAFPETFIAHRINWWISLLLFLLSFVFTFRYSKWLMSLFEDFGIFPLMIENMDKDNLLKEDESFKKEAKIISVKYREISGDIVFNAQIQNGYVPIYEIKSNEVGILGSINTDVIESIMKEIKKIETEFFFRLNKNIGWHVGIKSALPKESNSFNLLTVYLSERKFTADSSTAVNELYEREKYHNIHEEQRKNSLIATINVYETQITGSFNVIESERIRAEHIFDEIMELHASLAKYEPESLDVMVEKLAKFMHDFFHHEEPKSAKKLANILKDFLFNVGFENWDDTKVEIIYKSYLTFLEKIMPLALEAQSSELAKSIIGLSSGFRIRLAVRNDQYDPDIRNDVLGIQITGMNQTIAKIEKKNDLQKNVEFLKVFEEIIDKTYRECARYIYFLCKHHYARKVEANRIYITDNVERLIGPRGFSESVEMAKLLDEKSSQLREMIVRIAIFLFLQIEKGIFPKEWLFELIYPMVENCAPLVYHQPPILVDDLIVDVDKVLNRLVHKRDFPDDDFDVREWFRPNNIYVFDPEPHSEYIADKFWICLSIYRKIKHNRSYIPQWAAENSDTIVLGYTAVYRLYELSNHIQNTDAKGIAIMCGITINEANLEIAKYIEHLTNIINGNNEKWDDLMHPRNPED